MNCYVCNTTEQLSIKKRYKSGKVWMICKPCRRNKYHLDKEGMQELYEETGYKPGLDYINREQWTAIARESHRKILERC